MPVVPILVAASLAATVAGTAMQISGANSASKAQQQVIAGERAAEAQRQKAMELDAKRRQLEIVRQSQRARAMATSTANNQGALFGSGLQGGYGQIAGQTGTNLLGVQQNLQIGRDIFGINAGISSAKMDLASAQSFSAMGQGISSLGGAALKNLGAINSLSQGFGNSPYSYGAGGYTGEGPFMYGRP